MHSQVTLPPGHRQGVLYAHTWLQLSSCTLSPTDTFLAEEWNEVTGQFSRILLLPLLLGKLALEFGSVSVPSLLVDLCDYK